MTTEKKEKSDKSEVSKTPEKKNGNSSYSGTLKKEQVYKPTQKMVTVQFRENRKFELYIGRNMMTFLSRESKQIPASWLKHKDWQNIKHYFNIKGA